MNWRSEYRQTENNEYLGNRWAGHALSKDVEVELEDNNSLSSLRLISRRMEKNNSTAHGLLQGFVNTILGGAITTKVRYPDKSIENKLNSEIEKFTSKVDVNCVTSLKRWLIDALYASCIDGDLLVNLTYDNDKKDSTGSALNIESIDASRVFTPNNLINNPLIKNGVKYDEKGKVEFFYVKKLNVTESKMSMSSDNEENFTKVPAWRKIGKVSYRSARFMNCLSSKRPNQVRTTPLLTSSMGLIRFFSKFLEATLINCRVSACFVGVLQSDNPTGSLKNLTNMNEPAFGASKEIDPGTIMTVKNGKGNFSFASPNKPADNFDSFVKRLCMLIASDIRIPYIVQFLDLEKANYSNYKGGLVEVKRLLSIYHPVLSEIIIWILQFRLKEISLEKKIRFSMAKVTYDIKFPEPDSLDPEKEARSERLSLANKTTSLKAICDKNQISYEHLQEDLLEDEIRALEILVKKAIYIKEAEEKYGIVLTDSDDSESSESSESKDSDDSEPVDNTGTEEEKERRKNDGNW